MKKLILTCGLSLLAYSSFAQAIFVVEAPAAIGGSYNFSQPAAYYDATTPGFGLNITQPGNFVRDTVQFVTGADSVVANPLPAGSLTGKVAVVYRGGGVAFSDKAKRCQDAGAVGVIIIQSTLVGPDSVTAMSGSNAAVTIPVIQVSRNTGAAMRTQDEAAQDVVVYIGPAQGYFDDNFQIVDQKMVRPPLGCIPAIIALNATELSIPLGGWIYNIGALDHSGVVLNATITRGATEVYNQTTTPSSVPSGDSVFVFLPNLALASYPVGKYNVQYTVSFGASDQSPLDNTYNTTFTISDSLLSLARQDDARVIGVDTYSSFTFATGGNFQACMAFKNANADRLFAEGAYFGGLATNAPKTVVGEQINVTLYSWDDSFTNIDDATFDALNPLEVVNYTYTDAAMASQTIYLPFSGQVPLDNNQNYLVCVGSEAADSIFFAYDESTLYGQNNDTLQTGHTILIVGTSAYRYGSANGFAPSLALNTSVNDAGIKEEDEVTSSAYPNPARDVITVLVNGSGNAALKVTDLSGRLISTQEVKVANGQFTTGVEGMNAGTYVFSLDFENGTHSQFKVVVTK